MKNNKKGNASIFGLGLLLIIIIVFGAIMVIYLTGWDGVDANQIGVKKRLGKVIGTMEPGVQFTGFFTDVITYSTLIRKVDMSFTGAQAAWDSEKQDVYVDVSVTYTINKANALGLYALVGEDKDDNIENLFNVRNIISESVKQTTPKFSVRTIEKDREAIKDAIEQKIRQNFPTEFLIIDNVIVSNVDLNPAYKAEINERQRAVVTALKEKELVEVVKYQQQKETEGKKGELERRQLSADTQFYEAQKKAQGDAIKILEAAKAEAEGLRLKKQELTALLVQQEAIKQWNGEVPQIVAGGDSNMWISVPQMAGIQQNPSISGPQIISGTGTSGG